MRIVTPILHAISFSTTIDKDRSGTVDRGELEALLMEGVAEMETGGEKAAFALIATYQAGAFLKFEYFPQKRLDLHDHKAKTQAVRLALKKYGYSG